MHYSYLVSFGQRIWQVATMPEDGALIQLAANLAPARYIKYVAGEIELAALLALFVITRVNLN